MLSIWTHHKSYPWAYNLTLCHTILTFNTSGKENCCKQLWEKGENAGNQHFLLFPQCLLCILFPIQITIFESKLICHLQMLWIWTRPRFCRLVKSLSLVYFYSLFVSMAIDNSLMWFNSPKLGKKEQRFNQKKNVSVSFYGISARPDSLSRKNYIRKWV